MSDLDQSMPARRMVGATPSQCADGSWLRLECGHAQYSSLPARDAAGEGGPREAGCEQCASERRRKEECPTDLDRLRALFDSMGVKYEESRAVDLDFTDQCSLDKTLPGGRILTVGGASGAVFKFDPDGRLTP